MAAHRYIRIHDEETPDGGKETGIPSEQKRWPRFVSYIACVLAFFLCAALLSQLWRIPGWESSKTCTRPVQRREWRSLSRAEQQEYLRAVSCLTTKKSRMGLNESLHDDFLYVHVWHGHDTHMAASFFNYHRWFLHLYESALRDECEYQGSMTYWDWSRDWQDPYNSSIFDPDTAFGGEGKSVKGFRGNCVDEGPFANYRVLFIETFFWPHCLSREFLIDQQNITEWAGKWNPRHIDTLLEERDIGSFALKVETGPHRALPRMLHGDFSTRNAPIDPLFMLHHTNLDRLYWVWQHRDWPRRSREFGGKKTPEDTWESATSSDWLMYGDLGPSVHIRDTLDTEKNTLCYNY